MGIFDGKSGKQFEYLNEERQKLWDRIIDVENAHKALQKEVQKKASDSEKEAAQSSKKAAEFKNKTEQRLEEASQLVNSIKIHSDTAATNLTEIQTIQEQIEVSRASVVADIQQIQTDSQTLAERIIIIDEFLEKYPELDDQLEEVETNITAIEANLEKSAVTLTAINKRKKDIDDLYQQVFGYSETDTDGTTTKIEGLKDELDIAYEQLSSDVKEALNEVKTVNNDYKSKYEDFEKNHTEKYKAINEEIAALLPNALTAGLSAAFSKKKEEEVASSNTLQGRFSLGIYLLIGVSFLPFIVSAFFLYKNVTLLEVINRLPRLVLAIVPMYIPVLWFTYSANKKLNLSKRLIEEYAHKEVLSKTYEGLSKQIKGLTDPVQSDELKFRLLTNFLQVSSENPGKLISNYETSDHPVMEALEQSYKFQIAIDRLEAIPGLGKVAAILENNAKKKLAMKKEVIDRVLPNDDQEETEEEV